MQDGESNMIPLIPKEIQGKIQFKPGDVALKEGVVLKAEEKVIFDKFRASMREQAKSRMD